MIQVITFVLQLATAFLSVGANSSLNNGGSRHLQPADSKPTAIGSVKLTGSDNGFCQAFGQKNGCDANLVIKATLYDDESVFGKLTDVANVGNETILVQADVDCLKFLFIGEDKYAVVGGVYTKGPERVGRRYLGIAKEDVNGVVFYSGNNISSRTCDDITGPIAQSLTSYAENIDGQATIVFPSDPVNCGDIDSKKECRKSKECEYTNEGMCVSKDDGLGGTLLLSAESSSQEEAPAEVPESNASNSNQLTVTGSVKLTGSDNGICQALGLKNGCKANRVLQATLYDDELVVGKLTDVVNVGEDETILVQADVDCMRFLIIGEDKYAVVGGVYTKGDKLVDIFGFDTPFVGRRYVEVVKEDADGVVSNTLNFVFTSLTCDDVTEDEVASLTYFESIDGQASIVFPSDPVNCGEVEGKKECRKSKECEWDINEMTCVSKDGGLGVDFFAESFSKEEAPIQDMVNGLTSADPKMIRLGMVAGLFYALWL